MIEGIMSKFGYHRLPTLSWKGWKQLSERESDILYRMNVAKVHKQDFIVDYVKKTDTQKFYTKIGKKMKCVLEV